MLTALYVVSVICVWKHGARVSSTHILAARVPGQSANCPLPVDFALEIRDHRGMKKLHITRNQRRLLDGLCSRWSFEQQVELAGEIWDTKFKEIRRSFSRLNNLGFTEWIPESETSFGARWFVTEKGVRFLLDS